MPLQSNFLEILREYETEPPQNLQECIFDSIIYSNLFSNERIKEAEIIPDPSLLTSIEKVVGLADIPASNNGFWLRDKTMLKRICAAAAILIAITTSIIFISPKAKQDPIVLKKEFIEPEKKSDSLTRSIQFRRPATTKVSTRRKKAAQSTFCLKTIEQVSTLEYSTSEGDLWVKLVSIQTNANEMEEWINAVGEKKITIDEYSTLHVSDKIVKMIKVLHEKRENGKPTRKAIKTKRRMEKWKTKDEQFFNQDKSALDPIDLGNLLFNN